MSTLGAENPSDAHLGEKQGSCGDAHLGEAGILACDAHLGSTCGDAHLGTDKYQAYLGNVPSVNISFVIVPSTSFPLSQPAEKYYMQKKDC